jgi:hypothetical protein
MQILLITSAYKDIFTESQKNLLSAHNNNVDILSIKDRYYIVDGRVLNIKTRVFRNYVIELFSRVLFGFRALRKMKQYDAIHLLGWKEEVVFVFPVIKKHASKMMLTIYGQDTFSNPFKILTLKWFMDSIDLITFSSKYFFKKNSHHFPRKHLNKIHLVYACIDIFNAIDRSDHIQSPDDIICISCSTTRDINDNHFEIIDQLKSLKDLKEKIKLNFLLTYGTDTQYYHAVLEKIDTDLSGFNSQIYDSYLSDNELAQFRLNNKIFINLRTNDQFAGAMLEAMYAGAYIITGDWLPYKELEELGVTYMTIGSFYELASATRKAIDKIEKGEIADLENNRKIIGRIYHPAVVSKKWLELYYN